MASTRLSAAVAVPAFVLAALAIAGAARLHKETDSAERIGMAVEFMDHAAAAYVARDKGWYDAQGLKLASHESYVTGMALAAALSRRDVQVAYMCLVPAINAYANAGVPIRIVAGTHRYGYALVVDPDRVAAVGDIGNDEVRAGCVREGGAADMMLNRTIGAYGLDRRRVLGKVRRMNPPRLLIAIQAGQIDAAFMPEQWASMAEDLGFRIRLTARDVWPGMPGSVLVVKEELIREHPDVVRRLVAVNEAATRWINRHPAEAARTLARVLSVTGRAHVPPEAAALPAELDIRPATMQRSMERLEYATTITLDDVQAVIDYAAAIGYIRAPFPAEEIVDTRFMR